MIISKQKCLEMPMNNAPDVYSELQLSSNFLEEGLVIGRTA
jgi:hypothetical protein